ncbi:MAG: DUF4872 domain-containing protein [Anaerolineales bacterium]|nr:DUF4872 domain-containing protein [Anaerolineales bacterium]
MSGILSIPHRKSHGLCPVNGIRDLIQWRTGRDWTNEFVYGLGQGGGFAYLRFNAADPPRQVYWGVAGPRQHRYLAELLGAGYTEIENRSFKFSWNKAREMLEAGTPPVIGPLDMFYLPFYEGIYHKRHIPIHYLLLVGYDEQKIYVLDTGQDEVQELLLDELQQAWDVNVLGLGKKNRLAAFDFPGDLAPTADIVHKAIADLCQTMLHPPVSMVGIPAMRKVAKEIVHWQEELGEQVGACLRQVLEYLNSPPDIEGDHLTAGRHIYIRFLQEAGEKAGLDFSEPENLFGETIASLPDLAETIRKKNLVEAGACFDQIAVVEEKAFSILEEMAG